MCMPLGPIHRSYPRPKKVKVEDVIEKVSLEYALAEYPDKQKNKEVLEKYFLDNGTKTFNNCVNDLYQENRLLCRIMVENANAWRKYHNGFHQIYLKEAREAEARIFANLWKGRGEDNDRK